MSHRSRYQHAALLHPDAILAACKKLIEIIGSPRPDRHITTTIEILGTADISEYVRYSDKDRGSKQDDPEGLGWDAGTGSIPPQDG